MLTQRVLSPSPACFHSLQTGNGIPSSMMNNRLRLNTFAFPFPSNGKWHSKEWHDEHHTGLQTMFPFPSNGKWHSKLEALTAGNRLSYKFPFPSNGKWHSKQKTLTADRDRLQVSIPFKREMAFQVEIIGGDRCAYCGFPFPSNGKWHSKGVSFVLGETHSHAVSIPFKREKAFQEANRSTELNTNLSDGFHSLQTGKRIPSTSVTPVPKSINTVSIPFKRENAFQVRR